jgi:hypothetical protein
MREKNKLVAEAPKDLTDWMREQPLHTHSEGFKQLENKLENHLQLTMISEVKKSRQHNEKE